MNTVVIGETVRRHLTSVLFLSFLVCYTLLAMFASSFNTPGSIWPWLVTMLAIVTGAGVIGPEFSNGALQLIVSRPLSRTAYLLSRVAGVFLTLCIVAVTGFAAECTLRLIFNGPSLPLFRLLTALAGSLMVSLLTLSLLALLGSLTRFWFNAAIYIGSQLALTAGEALTSLFRARRRSAGDPAEFLGTIESALSATARLLFPEIPSRLEAGWILTTLAFAAVALVLACVVFTRREVPSASD